jgi:hypothetical protein
MASLVSILEAVRRYVLSTLRASFVFLLSSLSTTRSYAISGSERVRMFLPNARIGRIQGDSCDLEGKDVVIAMLQTLSMKEIPIATFKSIGLGYCGRVSPYRFRGLRPGSPQGHKQIYAWTVCDSATQGRSHVRCSLVPRSVAGTHRTQETRQIQR